MSKKMVVLSFCIFSTVLSFARHIVEKSNFRISRTNSGEVLTAFPSEYINEPKITVYFPKDYDAATKRYRVVYLPQGKCVFDKGLNEVNFKPKFFKTLNRLVSEHKISNVLIVEIEIGEVAECKSAGPLEIDLAVTAGQKKKKSTEKISLKERYGKFLALELIPYIDLNYRTLSYPSARLVIDRSFYFAATVPVGFGMFASFEPDTIYLQSFNVSGISLSSKLWIGTESPLYRKNFRLTHRVKNTVIACGILTAGGFKFDKNFVSHIEAFRNKKNRNKIMESMLMYFFPKNPHRKIKSLAPKLFPQKITKTDKNAEIMFGAGIVFKDGLIADYLSVNARINPAYFSSYKGIYRMRHNIEPRKVKFSDIYGSKKFSDRIRIIEQE